MSPREGHIARVRERVGNELLLVPSVSICLWKHDRMLLAHHPESGTWSTPGGAVEPDETVSAACRREAREELGIEVEVLGVAAVIGPEEVRYPSGDRTAYVTTAFACNAQGKPEADQQELDRLLWVGQSDVPSLPIAAWLQPWIDEVIRWRPGRPVIFS